MAQVQEATALEGAAAPEEAAALGAAGRTAALLMSPEARRLVQAALQDDADVTDLADRAAADPGFAARVLALANSGVYHERSSSGDVFLDCSRLGVRTLRNMTLSMVVADLVPAVEGAGALLSNCFRRAMAARELSVACPSIDPDDAFFTGLMLEVGLLHQSCEAFDACIQAARAPARHREIIERAGGLMPHPVMGVILARELALPPSMVQAIAEHRSATKPSASLSAICWAAEHVAATLEGGDRTRNLRWAERALTQIGVHPDTLPILMEKIPGGVQDLEMALEATPSSSRRVPESRHNEASLQLQYDELVRVVERLLQQRDDLRVQLSGSESR